MAASEAENPEQPVREQLKKATLDNSSTTGTAEIGADSAPGLSKKRSFEEVDEDTEDATGRHHNRKRSRDSTAELDDNEASRKRTSEEVTRATTVPRPETPEIPLESIKEASAEDFASPKTKRSRLQGTEGEESNTKLTPGSGFANTSAVSPFGAAMSAKSQQPASASAFAASKFSKLANGPSAFGSAAKTSGGFGLFGKSGAAASSEQTSGDKDESSTKSVFGGALGARSAFSNSSNGTQNGSGSVFGKSTGASSLGGSAFGSLSKGPGLSSFKSAMSAKPVSAPVVEENDGEENGDGAEDSGVKSPLPVGNEEDKKDERFYEQSVETGEEGEVVVFSSRAKLYTWATNESGKKEWKERGLGVLKLNTKKDHGLIQLSSDPEDPTQAKQPPARFLMRADGSHRVVLNTPIKKEIKVASPAGGPPVNGFLLFMGTIDGNSKLELLQIKLKQDHALTLYDKVIELQQE